MRLIKKHSSAVNKKSEIGTASRFAARFIFFIRRKICDSEAFIFQILTVRANVEKGVFLQRMLTSFGFAIIFVCGGDERCLI